MEKVTFNIDNAYEEALSLIASIRQNGNCPICGGTYHNSTCAYCDTPNATLEEILRKLNDISHQVISNVQPNTEKFNLFLGALYSLKEIDFIDELLTKYDFFNKMTDLYNEIITRISNNGYITEEEIPYIESIIYRNDSTMTNKGATNYIANYFIKMVLYNNLNKDEKHPVISYEVFEKMIQDYTCNIMKDSYGYDFSKCEILSPEEFQKFDDDELVLGENIANIIRFNRDVLRALYYYGNCELLEVFNHELQHSYQYKEIFSGQRVSLLGMIETKDLILRKTLPGYYQSNYKAISYEKEAFIVGIQSRLLALESYGLRPLDKQEKEQEIAQLQQGLFDTTRVYEDEAISLDDLFNKTILQRPDLLEKYPQLKYLYKLDNGVVIPKTREELQADYETLDVTTLTPDLKSLYEAYLPRNR